ncbi:DNA/RNA helicase [Vibrio phage vB_VpaS_AL-2]|nr:DNA/RNA helicase [Vibrio phage vB_VpaS_AL-2]
MKPRDYQEFGIEEFFRYYCNGGKGDGLLLYPTGTGKSIIIAEIVRRMCGQWPGTRVMMLTHVKELIEQNYDKLKTVWRHAPAGIYSAGAGRKDTQYPITFGGVQSVVKNPGQFGKIDLLIIDECHRIPKSGNTSYQKVIKFLKKMNPRMIVLGLTATAYRMGGGTLLEMGIFDHVLVDATEFHAFNWFFDQGYLCTLSPYRTETEIDLKGVGKQGGDFVQSQLQKATDKEEITHAAVAEMVRAAEDQGREHWLIFATGVEHCDHIVTEIIEQGYTAVAVHSKMSSKQRDENIKLFMDKKVTALVNMGVLTTGFDAPFVDLLGILRATESASLWVQILGRGTRTDYAEGYDLSTQQGRLDAIANSLKPDCLVLDFAGNTQRLGPINDPVTPEKKKKGGGEAPVRICDKCKFMMHASLRVCPKCGTEYPPEIKFKAKAGTDELIARAKKSAPPPEVHIFKVDRVFFTRKGGRAGKPDYLEIAYHTGLRKFTQPLCLEHEGFAGKKARDWWREATGCDDNVPETIADAAQRFDECRTPRNIRVHTNKKPYPQILQIDYEGQYDGEATTPVISF